jgi:hypothetical protein
MTVGDGVNDAPFIPGLNSVLRYPVAAFRPSGSPWR